MKILITGAGGFIGSALANYLKGEHEILALAHKKTGKLMTKLSDKNIQIIEGDIKSGELLSSVLPGVDTVVHLAGIVGTGACSKDPARAVMDNVLGTHVVLKESIDSNVENFIFASTQAAYFTFKKHTIPLTEDAKLEPDELYGALKAASECEIQNSGINYSILRFANIYGYGAGILGSQSYGAIGKFISAAYNGSEITIHGSGQQRIDYLNIEDLCNFFKQLLSNDSVKKNVFNVGSGKLHSIEDLASTAATIAKELYGKKTIIKKVPVEQENILPDRLMSIEKAKNVLKWEPKITLYEGMRELMEHAEEVLK